MRAPFREDRATQVAARFLHLEGGSADILKLVKLVYLVDRESLLRYGRPVTFDTFYSMTHGPVVSSTLDCINATDEQDAPYWRRFISPREDDRVELLADPGVDQLSPADVALIEEIERDWGRFDTWTLRDRTHDLPEWTDPAPQKRTPLRYREVLAAGGWAPDDIRAAIADLKAEASSFE